MKQTLIVAVAVVVSWAGAFGIAVGVQEWRGQTDSPLAMLEIEALQQQAQAEACRSATSFSQQVREITQNARNNPNRLSSEPAQNLYRRSLETMFDACEPAEPTPTQSKSTNGSPPG